MVTPLSEVVHEEPEHVAVEHVGVVQAVLVPLQFVLLDHLQPPKKFGGGPGGLGGQGKGSGVGVPAAPGGCGLTSLRPVSSVGFSAVGAQILTSWSRPLVARTGRWG